MGGTVMNVTICPRCMARIDGTGSLVDELVLTEPETWAPSSGMEKVYLENSLETLVVHSASRCEGQVCCIHNRSDHHMRLWSQHWRDDRGLMERICGHGIGHPDPDDWMAEDSVHSCCGCCVTPAVGVPAGDNVDQTSVTGDS